MQEVMPQRRERWYQKGEKITREIRKLCREAFTDVVAKIAFYHFLSGFYHVHKSLVVADAMTNYYWFSNANDRCAAVILIMETMKIVVIIYITANGHVIY